MLHIDDEERRFALRVARQSLISFIERGSLISYQTDSPGLLQRRGTFVTLRRRDTGGLRGCRGECRPSRPMIESLVAQTINAATDDPRFPTVRAEEIANLTLKINVLTPLKPIRPGQIVLGRHGLVVVQGRRSGLLLPEVPAYLGLQTPEEFLDALFRKADLPRVQVAEGDIELYAFETVVWGDEDAG
jgi:AmmeMemoRadiSam system protein A